MVKYESMDPSQILDRLTHYFTDEECEDIASIMFVVQEAVLPYGDLDDVSASLAFAKLSTPGRGS